MDGITIEELEKGIFSQVANLKAIIRVMPNTPALVGVVYCLKEHASSKHADATIKILATVGICCQVTKCHMDAYSGLCLSAPAYVSGHTAQTAYGSAKMVLDTKRHPGSLRDDVCSPGGTTIPGVHALEKAGFRNVEPWIFSKRLSKDTKLFRLY
ncbi:pyrroline-5-carboxylate reductase 2-like [Daphnia carinata]|uniref:pyrroline-5-carboxylate reductase 2-like n=1 Tax=Daphnia carinata TaxID=120202 RepID=UPI00257EB22A|nr:pyrroline-5-carboxylate reductase 2-like [Daphnia carinata]